MTRALLIAMSLVYGNPSSVSAQTWQGRRRSLQPVSAPARSARQSESAKPITDNQRRRTLRLCADWLPKKLWDNLDVLTAKQDYSVAEGIIGHIW